MMNFNMPFIPGSILHTMYLIQSEEIFDQESGGQWRTDENKRVPFEGAILPINNKDLIRDMGGSYRQYSDKVYTNGFELEVGGKVFDPQSGITYTVIQELGHNSLHPIKRYVLEAKERGKIG